MLSTKGIVASMMENDSVYLKRGQCELCGMHVEEWFNLELRDGAFGTYDWVAPADDPLGVLAMRLSREELAWSGGNTFCLACWASAEYLWHNSPETEAYVRFFRRFAGRPVPKPGLWHELLLQAWTEADELEEEIDFKRGGNLREQRDLLAAKREARHGEIAELIEDAMRKEPGAHSPVGDDDSSWKGIWLWDVKLGEVHPLTQTKRKPWELQRSEQPQ